MHSYTAWLTPITFLALAALGTPAALHPAHPHAVQRAEDGVFHFNTLLTLDLVSPYFSSGRQEEKFEVVVMESKEDGHVSFSIDSFPNMDPGAMELFYIQKVEQHRQRRAAFFSKLDEQTAGDARAVLNVGTSDPSQLAVAMMDYDPQQLLALLGTGAPGDPLRHAVGAEIARRLEQPTT